LTGRKEFAGDTERASTALQIRFPPAPPARYKQPAATHPQEPMTETVHPDGLPLPQRYWAILAIALGVTMAVIDGAIANIALPLIAEDLHASPAVSVWIVNGYQLAVLVSLLALSSLGEIVGYRRVYLSGLALFTAASLLCAVSRTLPELAAARVVQGFGAAGLMSVNGALLRFTYPHRQLGRGVGINALVVALAAALGPTLASAILSVASWPYLFLVNIPFGIAALGVGSYALPHTARARHAFDWRSALLCAVAFGAGVGAVDSAGHGGAPLLTGLEVLAAVISGVLLTRCQLGAQAPLLPVDLLRIPVFRLSIMASIAAFTAQMLAFVALPFYLRSRFGFSAVEIGLLITPWPIAIIFAAPLAGRLVERYPAGILGGIGLALFAAGLAAMALLPAHPSDFDIVWRMALGGVGFGLFQSPNNRTMLGAAPRERAGGASGMLGTARLTGQTLGAALVALMLARFADAGPRLSLVLGVGFALAGLVLSMLKLSPEGAQTAPATSIREP
jgi:DHA2 family multidrug resistance protein-like MFS transporter